MGVSSKPVLPKQRPVKTTKGVAYQPRDLFLLHSELRALVSHWPGPDGILHGLVLVRVPQHCIDHGDFCHRQCV